jgi:hypothetical protein
LENNQQETIAPPLGPEGEQQLSFGQAISRLAHRTRQGLRTSSVEEHNERVIYAETIFQALASAGGMSFVTVFLVRIGSPAWLVGMYSSLPALVTTLAVLSAGVFVQRQRSLLATINWSRLIFRSTYAAYALIPFLPITIAPFVLVSMRSVVSVPSAVMNVAVTTLWGTATTPRRRPRMLSTRLAIQGIFAAVIGLLAGQWLEWAPYPLNYQLLFLTVFVAGLGSILTLSRLRLPQRTEPARIEQRKANLKADLKELLPLIKSTPAFRDFALAAFVFRMGMNMPVALFPIMRVRELGATDGWIGVLLTVQRVLSVFTYFIVGSLASKPKYRRLLWLACIGVGLFPITMAMAINPTMLLIPEVIAGIFAPGMDIFLTDTLFRVSPEDRRPSFIAANSFLTNLIAFAGPLLGSLLAGWMGLRMALVFCGVLRIVGGFVFWRMGIGGSRERLPAAQVTS